MFAEEGRHEAPGGSSREFTGRAGNLSLPLFMIDFNKESPFFKHLVFTQFFGRGDIAISRRCAMALLTTSAQVCCLNQAIKRG